MNSRKHKISVFVLMTFLAFMLSSSDVMYAVQLFDELASNDIRSTGSNLLVAAKAISDETRVSGTNREWCNALHDQRKLVDAYEILRLRYGVLDDKSETMKSIDQELSRASCQGSTSLGSNVVFAVSDDSAVILAGGGGETGTCDELIAASGAGGIVCMEAPTMAVVDIVHRIFDPKPWRDLPDPPLSSRHEALMASLDSSVVLAVSEDGTVTLAGGGGETSTCDELIAASGAGGTVCKTVPTLALADMLTKLVEPSTSSVTDLPDTRSSLEAWYSANYDDAFRLTESLISSFELDVQVSDIDAFTLQLVSDPYQREQRWTFPVDNEAFLSPITPDKIVVDEVIFQLPIFGDLQHYIQPQSETGWSSSEWLILGRYRPDSSSERPVSQP